ncbi:hypothetical protein CXU21_00905 [Akkermansia muciniphila]|nr:hypothetical protein CXU21_00905 [Akkermansia muciniphila]
MLLRKVYGGREGQRMLPCRCVFPHPGVFLPVKEVGNVVRRQAVQVDSEFPASLWSRIHFPFMCSSSALVILARSVRVALFPCMMCHSNHLEAGFRQGGARTWEEPGRAAVPFPLYPLARQGERQAGIRNEAVFTERMGKL